MFYKILTIGIFFLIFSINPKSIFAGEPVPGAEVFVELEPDDQPIHTTTNQNGIVELKCSKKTGLKIWIKKINEKEISKIIQKKGLKLDNIKDFTFNITTYINNKKDKEFTFKKEFADFQSKSMTGPYGNSLSNIEDNIIVIKIYVTPNLLNTQKK
jgi:hypothetical protein